MTGHAYLGGVRDYADTVPGVLYPEPDEASLVPTVEALEQAISNVAKLDPTEMAPAALLALYSDIRSSRDRLTAVASALLERVDSVGATMTTSGVSTGTWLSQQHGVNGWQAQRDLRIADTMARYQHVRRAACEGHVSVEKSAAITRTLSRLPDEFTAEQRVCAESHLVERAGDLSASQITETIDELIALVDPAEVEHHAANRATRERVHALRDRYLSVRRDGRGMTHIRAGLPDAEGARIQQVLDALGAHAHHLSLDSRHPGRAGATVSQRRVDALALAFDTVHHDIHAGTAHSRGTNGFDQPRLGWRLPRARTQLRVTLTLDELIRALPGTRTVGGHELTPGDLRLIACDSEILPAVMGGPSQLLDLGRATRTVPSHLRDALAHRDRGCTFPGCDVAEPYCEAHHIQPWQEGGGTSLNNLALLCAHHHGMVEPPPGKGGQAAPHQWELRIAPDGVPEFLTPECHRAKREPRRHSRFHNKPMLE